MNRLIVAGIALTLLGATTASAEDLSAGEVTDIIRSLAPSAGSQSESNNAAIPTVRVKVKKEVVVVDFTHSHDFEVNFPFNSAEITPSARDGLLALGKALASIELRKHRFLIAGHTDAKGSAEYNRQLSERRAFAVRQFLLEIFAIDPEHLVAIGFGESRLKTPEEPWAGVNRRVEVALIVSQEAD